MTCVARFYKSVTVAEEADVFVVRLDDKPIKTPGRRLLSLPTRPLAEAAAEEWRKQTETLDPATMPFTRLVYAALDVAAEHRARISDEILGFGESDLLCYRADAPRSLAERQAAAWNPLLDWATERYGARLSVGSGIRFVAQSAEALATFGRRISACGEFALVALHGAASITGSLVLALALMEDRLDASEAFALSRLDEDFQADAWCRDTEAEARAARLGAELAAIAQFFLLCRARP